MGDDLFLLQDLQPTTFTPFTHIIACNPREFSRTHRYSTDRNLRGRDLAAQVHL